MMVAEQVSSDEPRSVLVACGSGVWLYCLHYRKRLTVRDGCPGHICCAHKESILPRSRLQHPVPQGHQYFPHLIQISAGGWTISVLMTTFWVLVISSERVARDM